MARSKCLMTPQGERIALVRGLRSPFAKQATHYLSLPALELGRQVVEELLLRSDLDPGLVDLLVFGQVIQTPSVPNIAREIVLATRLGVSTDAYSVTRACATSFQAVASVAEAIVAGQAEVAIAGGADSASCLPIGISRNLAEVLLLLSRTRSWHHRAQLLRRLRWCDAKLVAPAIAEHSTGLTMGEIAEQMAKQYHISREAQDAFAHRSHTLAASAWQQGAIHDEVAPIFTCDHAEVLASDNTIRFESELDSYARLKPVFDRQWGSVTAANSAPLTDGAAALLLMSEGRAKALGYEPLAYLYGYSFAGLPAKYDMLLGPLYATAKLLARTGCTLADLTLVEMHEAFAAQVLSNLQLFGDARFAQEKLGRSQALGEIDPARFNVLGGSLAYGHPFAATGARMIVQSVRELRRRGGGLALTTACAAGGLGAAMIWEVAS